jgi:hypothetical protein
MLEALASLFSNGKAVDDVLDKDNGLLVKAGTWIGNMNYTEEEKAKMAFEFSKVANDRLRALEPFKVVQRILAFGITFFWILVGINVLIGMWADNLRGCVADIEGACVPITPLMVQFAFSDFVFWPVVSVLSLYFIGGAWPGRFQAKN